MIVVADTTPLISLLKIRHFNILKELYGIVHIPKSVYDELTLNTDFKDEAEIIKGADFLQIHTDISPEKVDLLRRATNLDLGESEAIILADSEETKILLMDEARGRLVAQQMNIPITGVIGVLAASYKQGLLSYEDIIGSIQIMKNTNRFISERLYNLLLDLIK